MRFLEGADVLGTICDHARTRRVTAAVAYVGDGATGLLPLKGGDLLVVNGSRNALASGATSSRVLRRWFEQGVALYAHERLHSKVFVVGRTAFVGSANLSERASLAQTAEAAVETTEVSIVAQARQFIHQLAYEESTEIGEDWLASADSIPVRRDGDVLWNPEPPFMPDRPYDIWIGPEEDAYYSPEEEELATHANNLHKRGAKYGVLTVSESPDEPIRLAEPDLVILVGEQSAMLVRFLQRRASERAAMGFYRTDRDASAPSLTDLVDAMGVSAEELRSDWVRAKPVQRRALIARMGLPDLPPRTR